MSQKEKLKKCLDKIESFSSEELDVIFESAVIRKINKNEIILDNGQVCNHFSFVLSGAFYQYQMNDIEENIINLFPEFECALDSESFLKRKPSKSTIKAFVDSEILILDIETIHKLIKTSNSFLRLGSITSSQNRLLFFDNAMNPSEKYNYILKNNPVLIQTFPLKFIASYLKITPETLSRVRSL